jgi:hypothetical protein
MWFGCKKVSTLSFARALTHVAISHLLVHTLLQNDYLVKPNYTLRIQLFSLWPSILLAGKDIVFSFII